MDGALAEKLGTALQKLPDESVTRTRLQITNWAGGGMVYTTDLKSVPFIGLWVRVPPRPPTKMLVDMTGFLVGG